MGQYYFLASLLPKLEIGHLPELGFFEIMELIKVNLSKKDLAQVRTFLTQIDLENLRALWIGEPFDPRGNYSKEELEEALLNRPSKELADTNKYLQNLFSQDFLRDFLAKFQTKEERLHHFPLLLTRFFETVATSEKGFLANYFKFEREWRLVLAGFRAKKLGRNIAVELQNEDAGDPIVAQILAQKDAKVYEPPFEYKELKPIFEAYRDSPLELQKALYEYRFDAITEIWDAEHFSIDRILGYLAQLLLVENWMALDVQKGLEIIDTIERNIQ